MEFYKYVVLIGIMLIGYVAGLIVGRRQPINIGVELELQREIYELKNKLRIKDETIKQQNELSNDLYNKLCSKSEFLDQAVTKIGELREELKSKNYNGDAVQLKYYERLIEERDAKIDAMRNELQRLYKEAKEKNPYRTYKVSVKQKAGDVVRYKFYWEREKTKNMLQFFEDYLVGKIDVLSLHDDKTSVSFCKGQVTSIECEEQS